MTQLEFADAMLRRGCVGNDKIFCGTYNDYPFTSIFLNGTSGTRTQFQLQMQFSETVKNSFVRALNKSLPKSYRVKRIQNNNPPLLVLSLFTKTDAALEETMDKVLAALTELIPSAGFTLPSVCPVCKAGHCDSYSFYQTSYRPAHAACIQLTTQNTQMKAQKNIQHGSYFRGIIGAIIGGIVGAIPTLVLLALGYIASLLCALVPLCSYYGYKLLGGKMTRAVFPIVLLDSLLTVPFIHYIDFIITDILFGYDPTPIVAYISYLFIYPADMIPLLLQLVLYVGIGLAFVSRVIRRTGKDVIEDAAFSASTLRPIDTQAPLAPVAPPAPAPVLSSPEPTTGMGIAD